jgi:hypothetical protein
LEEIEDKLKGILHCNSALCYKALEDTDKFLEHLNESIKADKTYEKPVNLRAAHYYRECKWEECYEDYKTLKEEFKREDE